MTKTHSLSTISRQSSGADFGDPIQIGNRIETHGKIWEITFVSQQLNSVRFREVGGTTTYKSSITRARQRLNRNVSRLVRAVATSTVAALKDANLSKKDKIMSDWRKACVKSLYALPSGSSINRQELEILNSHRLFIENLHEGDRNLAPIPSYKTASRWKKMVSESSIGLAVLSMPDHRSNFRKKRIDERVEEIIREAFESAYNTEHQLSITDIKDSIDTAIRLENSENTACEIQLKPPCMQTISNRLLSIDPYSSMQSRHGNKSALRQFGYSRITTIPNYIGSIVYADSNLLDIMVYDNESHLTYRPWLTVFIDGYTRCVIGWDISILSPSSEKMMRTLRTSICSKDSHLYRCIPTMLHIDNGAEFINESLQSVAESLNILLVYSQTRNPNSKAIVERFFRTMNYVIHCLSGTTRSNPSQRGDYDSEGNAIYSLKEINEKFSDFLEIYHHRPHSHFKVSPRSRWEMACEKQAPRLIDHEAALTLGLTTKKLSISNGRVGFDGIHWYSPSLPELSAKLMLTNDKALLSFDPSDLSHAWVRHPREPDIAIRCDPCDPDYQGNLTLSIHKGIRRYTKEIEISSGNIQKYKYLKSAFLAKALQEAAERKSKISKRKKAAYLGELRRLAKSEGISIDLIVSESTTQSSSVRQENPNTSFEDDGGWDDTPDAFDIS